MISTAAAESCKAVSRRFRAPNLLLAGRVASGVTTAGPRTNLMRTTLAALLSLTLIGLMVAPAQGHRSNQKAMWGPVRIDGVSQFPIYHDLGATIYEAQLPWEGVALRRPRDARNPADPAYHWPDTLTDAVRQARRYHMRVLLLVSGAPKWANGGRPRRFAPRHERDFAAFMTAAARRYPGVHLWMVWGEPSRSPNFAPLVPATPRHKLTRRQAAAPHRYARILDAAYGALKRESPRNLVIGGNTYTTGDINPRQWVDNMRLPGGRPPRLDLYGHNPFSFREPSLHKPPSINDFVDFSDLDRLSRWVDRSLARRPGQHFKLFLSEFTIPTAPDMEFSFYVTRATQARWIRSAWRIVHRRRSNIYALGWIHLYDSPPGGRSSGGLLDFRGHRKPGYFAFRAG